MNPGISEHKRLKIIVDDNIPFLDHRLDNIAETIRVDQNGFTPEIVKDADALLIRTRTRCNRDLLEGSNVKLIATATIGMDQIDLDWTRENGIHVANAPGCNAPGVAQYVWSSLLHCGIDPKGLNLGVIGHGNVGSIVARWGELMGCEVLVCDPPREEQGMTDRRYLPMEEVLRKSDVVTLHTPLTFGSAYPTHHLISSGELAIMRPGAILVNAARGPVVDTDALIPAIENGKVSAIIDTWEGEPDLNRHLLELVRIGTYHIAGYSLEGKQRATRMVLEALERFFGVKIDKSGLAEPYTMPESVSPEAIMESYNSMKDMRQLVERPDIFDTLRRNYDFRREPVMNNPKTAG